ncbi:preprotein translocase subunit SecA [Bradyrhizobium sp. JR6.1]
MFGRCARQGDPGSCEAIISLDDDIFVIHAAMASRFIRKLVASFDVPVSIYQGLRSFAQFQAERRHGYVRVQNLQLDRRLDRVLAFSGRGE